MQRVQGCGLGASGYIGDTRYKNTTNLDKYLKGEYIAEEEKLTKKDKFVYEVMLCLRTYEAVLSIQKVREEYGVDLTKKMDIIEDLVNQGLLKFYNGEISITYAGMMVLDQIILKLI